MDRRSSLHIDGTTADGTQTNFYKSPAIMGGFNIVNTNQSKLSNFNNSFKRSHN